MATGTHSACVTQEQLNALVQEVLPQQGQWSQDVYLWLTDHTSRFIELTDGNIEVLPLPTDAHQSILAHLYHVFFAFLQSLGGKVLRAPIHDATARAYLATPLSPGCGSC